MSRPNLIFTRGGDESLHPTWLAQKDVARSWDLHISYFGSKDAPPHAGEDGVTFTKDDARYKWGGMKVCLDKKPFDIDAYEYIAFPDDDLVVTTEGWNRAFQLMKEYDIGAGQLALHPKSFYTINMTLQRQGTLLRFTNYTELMVPIAKASIFKRLSVHFADPQSSWGCDHVLADMLKDNPRGIAILDAAPALHTRAHGISKMYKDMTAGGMDYYQQEAAFLARLGLPKVENKIVYSALDMAGREIADLTMVRKHVVYSYVVRAIRNAIGQNRIVSINDGPEKLAEAMRWVKPR